MAVLQSTLETLFRQSDLVQLGVFCAIGILFYMISLSVMVAVSRRPDATKWTPVGPYFGAISVVFALFLAFHASDIWANKNQAERAFIEAGSAIQRIDELASPDQFNLPEVRSALRHHVRYVFRDEWRKYRNHSASDRADAAFHELQKQVARASRDLPPPIASQLNALFNDIARTRSDRLYIGANHTETTSWLAVLLLGLLTHFAVAAVHFDKPRAGAVALLILGVTTTLGFWSLGIVDDPYRLADQLNPYAWLPGS